MKKKMPDNEDRLAGAQAVATAVAGGVGAVVVVAAAVAAADAVAAIRRWTVTAAAALQHCLTSWDRSEEVTVETETSTEASARPIEQFHQHETPVGQGAWSRPA